MIINRLLIRIKTIQMVYAYVLSNNPKHLCEEDFIASFESSYKLYNYLLGLIVKVTEYRHEQIEKARHKYRPTEEERFPNEKFVNNRLPKLISENSSVMQYCEEHELFNDFDSVTYRSIFEQIEQLPIYEEYMSQAKTPTFEQDIELWKEILNTVFPNCEALDEMLEGKNIYWNDDLTTIIQFVQKTIKNIKEDDEVIELQKLFRNKDDEKFAKDLYHNTLEHFTELLQAVNDNSTNWEVARIATMEKVIMVTALAEVRYMPGIPVKITLNEYIDLSKYYCSGDSSKFVNGILDKAVNKWKEEGILFK